MNLNEVQAWLLVPQCHVDEVVAEKSKCIPFAKTKYHRDQQTVRHHITFIPSVPHPRSKIEEMIYLVIHLQQYFAQISFHLQTGGVKCTSCKQIAYGRNLAYLIIRKNALANSNISNSDGDVDVFRRVSAAVFRPFNSLPSGNFSFQAPFALTTFTFITILNLISHVQLCSSSGNISSSMMKGDLQ